MDKLYSRYNQSKELRVEDSPLSRWMTITDENISGGTINLSPLSPAPETGGRFTATEAMRQQESTIDAMERRAAEAVREQQPPTHGYASVRFPCGNCGYYLESVMAPNVTDTVTCPNCHRTTELRVVLNERRRTGE